MKSLSILIVEDEAIIAADLRNRLIKLGYRVVDAVATGSEAIAIARGCRPDVVLMDILLRGEMNGIEAAAQIRQSGDIPIIYVTSHTDHGTVDAATITEPAGYLLKPIDDRELKIALQMAIFSQYTRRELGRMERWMATTLNSIGDGLISTDAVGRIFYMNPQAEQLTGWHVSEAVGRGLEEVFSIADAESGRPIVDTVVRAMHADDTICPDRRITLRRRDENEIFVDQIASPIRDEDGNIMGVVLVFRDSTDSVRAETARTESESRLREACRARDRFFAALSHELRTPLTPVVMMLSNLVQDVGLPPHVREDLMTCLMHTEQEARLVDDLLDINRIMAGQLHIDRRRVDLHRVLRQAIENCAKPDDIRVKLSPSAKTQFIPGDEFRLRQLFTNLLANAHKLTAMGGCIDVHTCDIDGRQVRVSIADTGRGISAEMLPRVFDAFEQGNPATASEFGGLGLGLAIAKAIAEAHGGTIVAQSDGPGCGSTFIVTLPADPAEPASGEKDADAG